jgi:hypothetical protein
MSSQLREVGAGVRGEQRYNRHGSADSRRAQRARPGAECCGDPRRPRRLRCVGRKSQRKVVEGEWRPDKVTARVRPSCLDGARCREGLRPRGALAAPKGGDPPAVALGVRYPGAARITRWTSLSCMRTLRPSWRSRTHPAARTSVSVTRSVATGRRPRRRAARLTRAIGQVGSPRPASNEGKPYRYAACEEDVRRAREGARHGRELGRAVRDYLEYLEWTKPTRGRKRDTSPERIAEVEAQLAEADSPLQRLQLIQLRKDLEAAAETDDDPAEGERLRKAFVKAALPYSKSKGITYSAWREAGVPADVLRDAGITRGGS